MRQYQHKCIYIYIWHRYYIPWVWNTYSVPEPAHPPRLALADPRWAFFFITRTPVFLALRFSSRPAHATRTSSEQLRFCVSRAVCDQAAPRRSPRPVRRVLEPLPPGCCHQTTLHRRFPVRVLHVASPDVAGKRHVVSLFVWRKEVFEGCCTYYRIPFIITVLLSIAIFFLAS